jgi:hypothetical protein
MTATTMVEADALAFARDMIAPFHCGTNPWSDDSPLTAEAGRAFVRYMIRQAALMHPIHRRWIIAWAGAGDPDAADVLRTLIIEIQSRGDPMPTELTNYTMEVLAGGLRQPPARKKRTTSCGTSALQ